MKIRRWSSSISVPLYKQNIMIRTFIAFYFTNVSNWQGISQVCKLFCDRRHIQQKKNSWTWEILTRTHPPFLYIIKWTTKIRTFHIVHNMSTEHRYVNILYWTTHIYHGKHSKALFRCFSPLFHVTYFHIIMISTRIYKHNKQKKFIWKKCDKICRHVNEH